MRQTGGSRADSIAGSVVLKLAVGTWPPMSVRSPEFAGPKGHEGIGHGIPVLNSVH
jgi:hypothetical protein